MEFVRFPKAMPGGQADHGDAKANTAYFVTMETFTEDVTVNMDHIVAVKECGDGVGIWLTGRDPDGQIPTYVVDEIPKSLATYLSQAGYYEIIGGS